jgi:uncharacterized protein with HEPN domain
MKKNPSTFLIHIIDSINLIEDYLADKTNEDFLESLPLQDMTMRRLEIIGEAIKNIPQGFKDDYGDIPWKKISGLRDKLIHEYFGVDLDLTWNILARDLPELKIKIEKILSEINEKQ